MSDFTPVPPADSLKKEFPFVDQLFLREKFNFSKNVLGSLKRNLMEGVYYLQPDKKIFWNLRLVGDYLVRGGVDSPEHQALVAEYQQYMKNLINPS